MYDNHIRRRDRSGGIATGYKLDGQGFIPGRGNIFLPSTASRPVLGANKRPTQ
jgi:hypothetical protein